MRWIVLILLVSMTTSSYGQYKLIGVEGSLNLARVRPKGVSDGHKTGPAFGIDFQYLFRNPFSVGAGLIYEQKGFKSDITLSDVNGNTTGKLTHKTNINYLSIPLKVGLRFGNKFFGFTKVGLVPSLLINAKSISPNLNGDFSSTTSSDVSNRISSFDFAGLGEVGAGYRFNDRYWLTAAVLYQKSFTKVFNNEYFPYSDFKNDVKTVTIGLKYLLKN